MTHRFILPSHNKINTLPLKWKIGIIPNRGLQKQNENGPGNIRDERKGSVRKKDVKQQEIHSVSHNRCRKKECSLKSDFGLGVGGGRLP